MMEGE
jgi:hypothetical protein